MGQAQVVSAQNEAFDSISAGAFIGSTVSGGELLDSWESKPSLQISLQTPFYTGILETGMRYSQFTHKPSFQDYSDFQTMFIYLGWGYVFSLNEHFHVGPQLRFGTKFFFYEEEKRYPSPGGTWYYAFDTNESEFAYDLNLRGVYDLNESFSIYADFSYNRTLTYHPIHLNYISAGIVYTFGSPDWLRRVLK
ncbi:MAG: hypothetical protein R3222_04845 [Balneolaceae bacterium]|nr:hypothetical protein [Balneolaceae bacterium]